MAGLPEIDMLRELARRLDASPHKGRSRIMAEHSTRYGISVPTLYRRMKDVGVWSSGRKRRADAGSSAIDPETLQKIAGMQRAATRANGKRLLGAEDAVEIARANGVPLDRVDRGTGEIVPLSVSTVRRQLRQAGLDARTLARPDAHVEMRSLHPNHVWQVDASVCVLYYLDHKGLAVMNADEFYKNKPEAFKKRERGMVIRYLVTDHFSGAFHLRYFEGAESSAMLADLLIEAFLPKADPARHILHGVPLMLLADPGAANTAGATRNMLRRLLVDFRAHKVRNPRAKGSVEQHHNIIERSFESRLTLQRVTSLEELNRHADTWSAAFQSGRIHTRHGHTRYGLWQTIRADQLRLAPDEAFMRDALTGVPQLRTVAGNLTVSFEAREYDVRGVPSINVGDRVAVARNPYRWPEEIMVIETGTDGDEVMFACPVREVDAGGFAVSAAVIGQEHKSHKTTPAEAARGALDVAAWGGDTPEQAERNRRARAAAYAGDIDALEYLQDIQTPTYMQRRGTDLPVRATRTNETARMSAMEATRALIGRGAVREGLFDWISSSYAEGVPEDGLDEVLAAWTARNAPGLRAVG